MPVTVLITSGPTREFLDPVRFLSNASSGKMGAALAAACLKRKAKVIFVTGPAETPAPRGVQCVPVTTAREMLAAVKKSLPAADIVIGAAAVADYRPAVQSRHKIKKDARGCAVRFIPNPDIIKYAGQRKGKRIVVGFALESKDLFRAAQRKMAEKHLDMIVANAPGAIGSDKATARLMRPDGSTTKVSNAGKTILAQRIIDEALRLQKDRFAR